MPPRTNSFKASSNNTTRVDSNAFKSRPDRPRNHQLTDLVQDIHPDFAENGVFINEMGDLDNEWKRVYQCVVLRNTMDKDVELRQWPSHDLNMADDARYTGLEKGSLGICGRL
ncbi:hypothetical protein ACLOJK_029054 [Asimina triloba]